MQFKDLDVSTVSDICVSWSKEFVDLHRTFIRKVMDSKAQDSDVSYSESPEVDAKQDVDGNVCSVSLPLEIRINGFTKDFLHAVAYFDPSEYPCTQDMMNERKCSVFRRWYEELCFCDLWKRYQERRRLDAYSQKGKIDELNNHEGEGIAQLESLKAYELNPMGSEVLMKSFKLYN